MMESPFVLAVAFMRPEKSQRKGLGTGMLLKNCGWFWRGLKFVREILVYCKYIDSAYVSTLDDMTWLL